MVDADLESYFDTIPHEQLMKRMEERVSDGRVLDLLRSWLGQEVLKGLERWTPTGGTPQGAVISPLLANIYLHPLDRRMAERGYRMVRYADDFVVLCKSREEAEAALAEIRAWVRPTAWGCIPTRPTSATAGSRGKGSTSWATGLRPAGAGAQKSLAASSAIKERRDGLVGDSLERSSPISTRRSKAGSATSSMRTGTFVTLDKFIRSDYARYCASRRSGQHRAKSAYHQRWHNAYFAQSGLFALYKAWHAARHSR